MLHETRSPLHAVAVGVLAVSTFVFVAAVAGESPKKVSADELTLIITSAPGIADGELAQKLTGMALTERLSRSRLDDLTRRLPGDRSRLALRLLADESIFLPPPATESSGDPAPDSAAKQQMLVKLVNYVNVTVRQLPNLMAMRSSNGFEDRPREDRLTSTGVESLDSLPLHWVGSQKMEVTYRDRQEVVDKGVKAEKKGNGIGGLITTGEFGPILSTVLADALKGKIVWTRWEKGSDGRLAVFHYQVPADKSNYLIQFCCIPNGYGSDGLPQSEVFKERSAYDGDIVFSAVDGSVRLLTLEAEVPTGTLVSRAGIAIEYAATDVGGRSYICPSRSVSLLQAHTAQQNGAFSRSNYRGPAKTFLNDVTFSEYRRFGSETKILTSSPEE